MDSLELTSAMQIQLWIN